MIWKMTTSTTSNPPAPIIRRVGSLFKTFIITGVPLLVPCPAETRADHGF